MCRMLLSINPQFVEKIIDGSKVYEFRKFRCKPEIKKVVIYVTAPYKKVVAEADICEVLEDETLMIWKRTKAYSGINYVYFRKYYKGKKKAYAYHLKNVIVYENPLELKNFGVNYVPQSFCYID